MAASRLIDHRPPRVLCVVSVRRCVAGKIESDLAAAGFKVFSNAKNHRYDDSQPNTAQPQSAQHITSCCTLTDVMLYMPCVLVCLSVCLSVSCAHSDPSCERVAPRHHPTPAASEGLAQGRIHCH